MGKIRADAATSLPRLAIKARRVWGELKAIWARNLSEQADILGVVVYNANDLIVVIYALITYSAGEEYAVTCQPCTSSPHQAVLRSCANQTNRFLFSVSAAMNLQQIRYVREIAKQDLNLTQAALALHTSQPGVSRQVREFEDELGVDVFVRQGKRLTALTPAGEAVVKICERLLGEVDSLKRVGREFADADRGELVIAATHMQARYALPQVVKAFLKKYPNVRLSLRQGAPRELAQMVIAGEADLAIATETLDSYPELVTEPLYRWHHCVILPKAHPLANEKRLTLAKIAQYPIVTYDAAFSGRSALDETFATAGLEIDVVLTAIDTDVIKTYVREGLGVGIIAGMAVDTRDHDLVALDGAKLFPERVTKLAYRKNAYLRGFVRDFIDSLATHLRTK